MPNTLPTNLANALTELVKRRQDIRTQDRQAPTDEAGAEPFGALVSEWAQASQGTSRQEMRARPSRDQRPEIEPPAHPTPRAEDVVPRSRSSEARSRTDEAPRPRREATRSPERDDLRTEENPSDDRPVTSDNTRPNDRVARDNTAKDDATPTSVSAAETPPNDSDCPRMAEETVETGSETVATDESNANPVDQAAAAAKAEEALIDATAEATAVSQADPSVAGTTDQAAADGQTTSPSQTQTTGATTASGMPSITAAVVPPAMTPLVNDTTGATDAESLAIAQLTNQAATQKTAGKTGEAKTESKGDPAEVAADADAAATALSAGKPGTSQEPGVKPFAEEAKGSGATDQTHRHQQHHPVKTTPFAELFNGLGTQNAIYKPADVLAGLDRAMPAAASGGHDTRQIRPTPMQMLPIEIGMQAVRGVTSFQIRLDPAELGRVDVRLDIKQNGEVNASLVVDRVETLQMLRRDASTLQQAFEQAGLKQSPDGLNFSLRGEGQQGHQHERGQQGRPAAGVEDIGMPQMGELVMRRALISNSSLDLMI
jgi:flagellar hook-length control protein FliK